MGQKLRAALAAAAFAASVAPAAALVESDYAADTAGQLATICAARGTNDAAAGMCFGFIEGAGQFYNLVTAEPRFNIDNVICADRELTREEIADFVVTWVGSDAERAAMNPIVALIAMGGEQFPCN
jgi:hypothetical protein